MTEQSNSLPSGHRFKPGTTATIAGCQVGRDGLRLVQCVIEQMIAAHAEAGTSIVDLDLQLKLVPKNSVDGALTDRERHLGEALLRVLIHDGVLLDNVGATGPELICAAQTYVGETW